MALTEKYRSLIDIAKQRGVNNLQATEQEGVLYVPGSAANGELKLKYGTKSIASIRIIEPVIWF